MKPVIAIIGRPNVGKSTLFNRLTGTRHALVDNQPGVTRDRRPGEGHIGPLQFEVLDTAGLEVAEKESLADRMTQQTLAAVQECDLVLLVFDATAGITPQDAHFAEIVRRSGKPVVLLANKSDAKLAQAGAREAYELGLGEPVLFSAEHGLGLGDLYDAIVAHTGQPPEEEEDDDGTPPIMQLAVVGRPNVGKSTYINALLKEDRLLTGPEAGITRDAIAVDYLYKDQPLKLIDTAGMRRKANVQEKVERLAVADTRRAIQYAHVVVLMMDATMPMEKQDLQIADMVAKEGRACVLVLNKWDQVPQPEHEGLLREIRYRVNEVMPQFRDLPVVTVSATKGKRLTDVLDAAFAMYEVWNRRIPTAKLNEWLAEMVSTHTPPLVKNRRVKLKYITQMKTRPPSFALHVNMAQLAESYRRYLVNGLRKDFDLPGVPIRLVLRKGKNPYDDQS
jgi:GTP-binding protein